MIATLRPGRERAAWQLRLLRAMGSRASGPVLLGRQVEIHDPAKLTLGARVAIGPDSRIVCWAPIEIGDDFLGAGGLHLDSGSHSPESLEPLDRPIRIGHRVWCGTRVTICAGVEIGDDVVLGAGAVVVKSIPAGVVAAGVPAKPLRPLNRPVDGGRLWSIWDR